MSWNKCQDVGLDVGGAICLFKGAQNMVKVKKPAQGRGNISEARQRTVHNK